MGVETRPELQAVRPVRHGSVVPEDVLGQGLAPADVIDFSVSTNPLGPPPGALAALAGLGAEGAWRYPHPTALPLRRALAAGLALDPEQIVVGNGSSELIWSLALAYVRPRPAAAGPGPAPSLAPGTRPQVLICGPTYGEYERASRLLGAGVQWENALPPMFEPDVQGGAREIVRRRPSLVWLCNPNNPTGGYLPRRAVVTLLDACVAAGSLLVVDEAYLPFVQEAESLLDLLPSGHLFLLRSLTKDYALAGLRLGYGLGTAAMAGALRLTQPPWSVNTPAQAAGAAALADAEYLDRGRAEVWAARRELVLELQALGLRVTPPAANFVLVEVGDAALFRARLLRRGCVVRDCTSFGLPGHVRIGVRTGPECAHLIRALREILGTAGHEISGAAAGEAEG